MKRLINGMTVVWLIGIASHALAQEQGSIRVQTVAEQEEVLVDESGNRTTRLVPVSKVVPGDEVIYTITFTNIGDEAAQNVSVTNPVPAHMRYVDGSAFGAGTDITFSVDGGNSYGSADELVVVGSDGSQRPATAEDYTHIRWVMRNEAKPGASGFTRFRAVLE